LEAVHDLRHTCASWHRQVGTPTRELQRLGGLRSSVMVGYDLATLEKEKGAEPPINPLIYW
jgi:integrase